MSTATLMVDEAAEQLDVEQFARDQVRDWSAACQRMINLTRSKFLMGDPSPQELEAHRSALKWMLRHTRGLHLTMADPDFPDQKLAEDLEGRVIQLEHLWRMVQAPKMSDAEVDELIAKHFPG